MQTRTSRPLVARELRPSASAPTAMLPVRSEGFVEIDGREMYCIPNFDRMPPFLMTLASDCDLWMYVSSFGGLTAGRIDEEHCLFPYETEDRLHHAHGITGPITILRVSRPRNDDWGTMLWEPFNHRAVGGAAQRNLYKDVLSSRVIFEEIHRELGLVFTYEWAGCDEFGFVRTARLRNENPATPVKLELLDGLLNITPPGIGLISQQSASSLADAYKRCELDPQTGMAIYSLSSIIHDRPEPAECLKANVIWSRGLEPDRCRLLLCDAQVQSFREGASIKAEDAIYGRRGAFLLCGSFTLHPREQLEWDIVANADRDHVQIEHLRKALTSTSSVESHTEPNIRRRVALSLRDASQNLRRAVAACDGLQCTQDRRSTAHHAANVLFNNMRGGMPADQYRVRADDFRRFVRERNRHVHQTQQPFLRALPETLQHSELLSRARAAGDADLVRLAHEYLPLTFGRRHGDPSRPWNRFCIRVKNPDGSAAIRYQGNWRDIFQNWEALAGSFPLLLVSFIARFVNASTIDGFNPYRITSEGIDWEKLDPDSPWSNIGYWGDHQIVYLLKFLEAAQRHFPGAIRSMLREPIFAYANVPYRLKPHAAIVADPHHTIDFDRALDREIESRVASLGADGKLLLDSGGRVYHVNLAEKLLVPLLAKLCSFVADGGIWMNTQRPEWNDANNALAGYGLSVVTLCYLRRYVSFLLKLLSQEIERPLEISTEVANWLDRTGAVLQKHASLLRNANIPDRGRRLLLDDLGIAFEAYRTQVYTHGVGEKCDCDVSRILPVLRTSLEYLDHAIRANRRDDGLYHAYNLLHISASEARIERLYEMLEGQVAALSSGCVGGEEALALLDSLLAGPLFRQDQQSLMLYPNRRLASFLQQNRIATARVESNPLLRALIDAREGSIVGVDVNGCYRFNGEFRNADDLRLALQRLAEQEQWNPLVKSWHDSILELFEETFRHHRFTGRSGAMYGYEGLGCVYWHMVCKLLLAVQECFWRADREESAATATRLAQAYYRIRDGLGFNKSARQYGAFPTDPYSHTPLAGGARQPGMTGQVKEEILTRLGELGVLVENGQVRFRPILLRAREFLTGPASWNWFGIDSTANSIQLDPGTLAFTYCQVPVVYRLVDGPMQIRTSQSDGPVDETSGEWLDSSICGRLFARDGSVCRLDVAVPRGLIRSKD